MEPDEIHTIKCNRCGAVTFHDRLASRSLWGVIDEMTGEELPGVRQPPGIEDEWPDANDFCETYELFKCRGCNEVCLRVQRVDRDDRDDNPPTRYYPPRIFRRRPSWFAALRPELVALLDEVYAALAADSPRLSAMGLRAVMDMVLSDLVGDSEKNFFKKLEKLEEQGLIGRANRDQLAAALEVGHAAAHRGYSPPPADLEQVVNIVETLLMSAYQLKDTATKLKQKTPRRFPHGV